MRNLEITTYYCLIHLPSVSHNSFIPLEKPEADNFGLTFYWKLSWTNVLTWRQCEIQCILNFSSNSKWLKMYAILGKFSPFNMIMLFLAFIILIFILTENFDWYTVQFQNKLIIQKSRIYQMLSLKKQPPEPPESRHIS